MDERRDPDRNRPSDRRSVGRRSLLGGVGGLALAALAGCTTTEKPQGTFIEGDGTADGGNGTTTEPGTPTPREVFTLSDTSFGPNDEGYMTYAATVENSSDERWAATLHATLELDRPITPEGDEESATPTPLTPRETELTERVDLAPGATENVTLTFDVTDTVYFQGYRSASFGTFWSDLSRP